MFVACVLAAMPTRADYDAGKLWFNSLDQATQYKIQTDLVLLGDYGALVDGSYGSSTFGALQKFQTSEGRSPTGVLTNDEVQNLADKADEVRTQLGLEETQDEQTGLDIYLPLALLPNHEKTASGNLYKSDQNKIELETVKIPNGASDFGQLYRTKSSSSVFRTVSYKSQTPTSFTVSGSKNGRAFYERYYLRGQDAVGFKLSWDHTSGDLGATLATYLASYSRPTPWTPASQATVNGSGFASNNASPVSPVAAQAAIRVPLQPAGGTFRVPVEINGALTLDFTLDSGASDVSIPGDVFLTLNRTGTVTASDVTGSQTYELADGSTFDSTTFRLRSLKIGGHVIYNVAASVGSPTASTLLLGQSFLRHFSSWSIDNKHNELLLYPDEVQSPTMPPSPPLTSATSAESGEMRLAIYGGLDFYGNDIYKGHTGDAVECATQCLRNSQCRAFTFNANPNIHSGPNCFLKREVGRLEAYSSAIGGLILDPGEKEPAYRFDAIDPTTDLMSNRDLTGRDLSNYPYARAVSVDLCRAACIDNSQCVAFSFAKAAKQCWLKGSVGVSRRAQGIVSGRKRQVYFQASEVLNLSN